jgi:hypothetical protein
LYRRFVGVTAGLGTCRTLNWTGSRNTAPDTPTGAVTTAINSPAPNPRTYIQGIRAILSAVMISGADANATGRSDGRTTLALCSPGDA